MFQLNLSMSWPHYHTHNPKLLLNMQTIVHNLCLRNMFVRSLYKNQKSNTNEKNNKKKTYNKNKKVQSMHFPPISPSVIQYLLTPFAFNEILNNLLPVA